MFCRALICASSQFVKPKYYIPKGFAEESKNVLAKSY